jgi:glycosyltransferase involved in cell wall biosynthesis
MTISVVIPAFNCAPTIGLTLDSVLVQSHPADEILVVDNGSTDETPSILNSYGSRVAVSRQNNRGTAVSRNIPCERAAGDLLAFLDSDDLWHPEYLQSQAQLFEDNPHAAALFTGHVDVFGYGDIQWSCDPDPDAQVEIIPPLAFIKRYNARPGPFNMSYCCVPKSALTRIGPAPFGGSTARSEPWAEDCYFHNRIALCGPVLYFSRTLAAYRISRRSVSLHQLKWTAGQVAALEQLRGVESGWGQSARNVFRAILSSKRRAHAKRLLGATQTP